MVMKASAQTKRLKTAIDDYNALVPSLVDEASIEEDHAADGNWPWLTTGE